MLRQWGCWQERREGMLLQACNCNVLYTSLLSASWLLLLGWAVTRASSQPDDPVISLKPIADALLEPPAHWR